MINPNSEITEVIIRHLQGKASEAEEAQLKQWLGQSAENASFYSDYRKIWDKTKLPDSDFTPDVDAAWRKVRTMAGSENSPPSSATETISLSNYRTFWRIAAAIVFMVGLGYLAFKGLQKDIKFIEVVASEKMEVKLPDGSMVALNKNARLRYPEEFESTREVFLEGEAFFQVKRDTTKPFMVQGKLTTTEVLGTSFNVRAIPGENYEETSVITGKVSFREKKSAQQVILTPGLKGQFNTGGKVTAQQVETSNTLAWKTGQLKFEDTQLSKVTADLSEYFGKEIKVSGELAGQKFTGNFNNPNLDQVLNIIAISTDAQITRKDSSYMLTKK